MPLFPHPANLHACPYINCDFFPKQPISLLLFLLFESVNRLATSSSIFSQGLGFVFLPLLPFRSHFIMYQKRVAYGLFAAFAAVASAADAASDVEQLTKDSFDSFIKSNDLVLAECKSPMD